MKAETFIAEFVQNALYRIDENTRMIGICFEKLAEEDVWVRPNNTSNSIGNLILHLCGNITQYAISSLGQSTDNRDRAAEFETSGGPNKAKLLKKLKDTVNRAKDVIENAPIENWLKTREVQGFNFSGIGVLLHVVEHYSYHTGQIAFWVKQLKNNDLGFYDGVNLNVKNKE